MLPTDIVQQEIPAQSLQKPLNITPPPNAAEKQQAVIDTVHDLVTKAQGDVVVIVDACVIRHHVRNEVKEFLKATGFPVYATPMGKTAIDENNPRYGGVSMGSCYAIRDTDSLYRSTWALSRHLISRRRLKTRNLLLRSAL